MCLAIYKPKGVQVKKRYLRNGFAHNSDGAGFAIARDGQVEIFKGFMTWDAFWKAYEPYQSQAALIHFRWTTHGKTNEVNTHPFLMCDGTHAVIHNGVLNIKCVDTDMSDTWHFVTLVLEPLVKACSVDHPAVKYVIEEAIGSFNKIAVLRGDGTVVIFNEDQGSWHNGAWYSNENYKSSPHHWTDDYMGYGGRFGRGCSSSATVKSYPPSQVKEIEAELMAEEGEDEVTKRRARFFEDEDELDQKLRLIPDYEPRVYQLPYGSEDPITNQELTEA